MFEEEHIIKTYFPSWIYEEISSNTAASDMYLSASLDKEVPSVINTSTSPIYVLTNWSNM